MYMQGDKVRYAGRKFARELSGKGKVGEVVAHVQNQPGAYVVDFGDDSYVMGERSLERWRPTAAELKEGKTEPTVEVRRRKRSSDEEETG
jgi:hypothetical protein